VVVVLVVLEVCSVNGHGEGNTLLNKEKISDNTRNWSIT
jgi:hypothetical protein